MTHGPNSAGLIGGGLFLLAALLLFAYDRKLRVQSRRLTAATEPGRCWVQGKIPELTVSQPVLRYAGSSKSQKRVLRILSGSTFAPPEINIHTAEGEVRVDLRDAWFLVPADPKQNEHAESLVGAELEKHGFAPASTPSEVFGALGNRVSFTRQFPARSDLMFCGVKQDGRLRAPAPGVPLLVVEPGISAPGPALAWAAGIVDSQAGTYGIFALLALLVGGGFLGASLFG